MTKEQYQQYMAIAYQVAKKSTCIKRQVGAIIVKDNKIISTGWNHSPFQICNPTNCIRDPLGKGAACGHAEAFAILNCTPEERKDAIMFLTLFPCTACQILLMSSGISKVIYNEEHTPRFNWIQNNSIIECISLQDILNERIL